jgi:hypothetical protein
MAPKATPSSIARHLSRAEWLAGWMFIELGIPQASSSANSLGRISSALGFSGNDVSSLWSG